jgi:asparagine synthase (glutamine-hydrolysing)
MKALWAAGVHKKMDNEMLLNYLTLGWVQNPVNKQQTFFEDIISLPPSHYLLCKLSRNDEPYLEVKGYWDIDKESQVAPGSDNFVKKIFWNCFALPSNAD